MWGVTAGLLVAAMVTWQAPGRVSGWASRPAAASASVASPPDTRQRVTSGDSLVVFAAHPDDEVLGAGGLIHAAVAAGARVSVVLFTNGDGYVGGVNAAFRPVLLTPDRFIAYGQRRQQEALAAAAHVGLTADRLTFLGYPDRGLAVLWGPAWSCDHLYTSPFTRRNHSPYSLAYRAGVAYCGQRVLEDVESVLTRERPTIIVSHDAEDTHRDHWAAGAFVIAALEHLRAADPPWARTARVWPYLVHRGGWPLPRAYAPDLALTPPADLLPVQGGWTEYPLDQSDQDAKRMAILQYRSQVQLLRAYMLSFVRQNELFDIQPRRWAAPVEGEVLPITAPELWDRLPPIIQGTPGDPLVRAAEGSAKLDTVGLGQDSARLYVAVRLRRAAIREAQYRVVMMLLSRGGRTARLRLLFRVPQSLTALQTESRDLPLPAGAMARSFGHRINIVLPLAGMENPASLLMHVETTGPLQMPVERSPWVLVGLAPAPEGWGPGGHASRAGIGGRPGRFDRPGDPLPNGRSR